NYEHRRQWIQDRIQFLAGQFGVDVLGFAVMSNHLHVVVRNRPDVVRGWSDDDVARRWWNLFPKHRDDDGNPKDPTDFELLMITADPARLAEIRQRLSSVSWFMRCLVEPIARSDVNATQRGVDWQMKIDDARTKLKSVYPTIKL
ncbi:MAG: hypothetical protein WBE90_21755, partial [Xanthobacteraceae bacterium]